MGEVQVHALRGVADLRQGHLPWRRIDHRERERRVGDRGEQQRRLEAGEQAVLYPSDAITDGVAIKERL